jgi:hypothetical protein
VPQAVLFFPKQDRLAGRSSTHEELPMIALIRNNSDVSQAESLHDTFLAMLPQIRRQAAFAFRALRAEAREELVEEVVALAYAAFVRLARRGKAALAYPTPLASFAVRQVRGGRSLGCPLNKDDVLSPYARQIRGFTVERLDECDPRLGTWHQLLIEDRRAGPAETAAARLDVADWFRSLTPRQRRIARALALGEKTKVVAQRFGLTCGRISQLRGWFRRHWERFQSETQLDGCAA